MKKFAVVLVASLVAVPAASRAAGGNQEALFTVDRRPPASASIKRVQADSFAMPDGASYPLSLFTGMPVCVTLNVTLAGKSDEAIVCFTLGRSGDTATIGAVSIQGGCVFTDTGAARLTGAHIEVAVDPARPKVSVLRVASLDSKQDQWGCAGSSPVTAVFRRKAVASINVTSTGETQADVWLRYPDSGDGTLIGKTNATFQVPYEPPKEDVLVYVTKPGFEPCAFRVTAGPQGAPNLQCALGKIAGK